MSWQAWRLNIFHLQKATVASQAPTHNPFRRSLADRAVSISPAVSLLSLAHSHHCTLTPTAQLTLQELLQDHQIGFMQSTTQMCSNILRCFQPMPSLKQYSWGKSIQSYEQALTINQYKKIKWERKKRRNRKQNKAEKRLTRTSEFDTSSCQLYAIWFQDNHFKNIREQSPTT